MRRLILAAIALFSLAFDAKADFAYEQLKDELDGSLIRYVNGWKPSAYDGDLRFSLLGDGTLAVTLWASDASVLCPQLDNTVLVQWSSYRAGTPSSTTSSRWGVTKGSSRSFETGKSAEVIAEILQHNDGIKFRVSDECGNTAVVDFPSKGFNAAMNMLRPVGIGD